MKRTFLVVVLSTLALTGCSRHYAMTMTNGSRIVTASKPKLKNGSYFFKNAEGKEVVVPAGRVRQITPASSSSSDDNPFKLGPGGSVVK
jgi:hypothetical protein